MANITVRVPDEVYRRARVHAAEHGTSVSALVADFLCDLDRDDTEFRRLEALQDELIEQIRASGSTFSAADRLSREELYDRPVMRRGLDAPG